MEIWKDINGFENKYSISQNGDVRNKNSGRLLKQWKCYGYSYVGLHQPDLYLRIRVHKLVALYFIGDMPLGKQINHIDGNKSNNHFSNLEYITSSENNIHAIKMGLTPSRLGNGNGHSKLKEKEVIEIRKRYSLREKQKDLAKEFNVYQSRISTIVNRKEWKHV